MVIKQETVTMAKTKEQIEEVIEVVEPSEEEIIDAFIARRLLAINRMTDKAKAKRLAERVLSNRKRGK